MIRQNVMELIGNTPLLQLNNFGREYQGNIIAKLELFNPAGSVKDRVGLSLIEDAESKGILKEGSVIVEPTSGNTRLRDEACGRGSVGAPVSYGCCGGWYGLRSCSC